MRIFLSGLVALILGSVSALAADVSGTWKASVALDDGRHTAPTFTLKQSGEKITGMFLIPAIGERPLSGTIRGNEFSFHVDVEESGIVFKLAYQGKIEDGKLAGTMLRTEDGNKIPGKFTATKQ